MGYFNPVSSIQYPVSDKTFTFANCYNSKIIDHEK